MMIAMVTVTMIMVVVGQPSLVSNSFSREKPIRSNSRNRLTQTTTSMSLMNGKSPEDVVCFVRICCPYSFHTHTHTVIHSHIHSHTQIHTHKYTHTHIHTHTYTHIHKNVFSFSSLKKNCRFLFVGGPLKGANGVEGENR